MGIFNLEPSIVIQQMAWYEEFHASPELSMKEFRTTKRIKEILTEMGVELLIYSGEVGVVARIEGRGPGEEVLLRADIDALPIQEESGLTFTSKFPDISHMCGHDFHISALLAAAYQLQKYREEWEGSVKLIFQPAEETTQGARYMIERGVLSGKEKASFGLHNAPFLPVGKVGIRKGPFFASADTLHIQVWGRKGHAALPHLTVDATVASSAIVLGLQTAISRNINPLEPCVVTIGSLHSGQGHNVVSDYSEMWGTIRTFSREVREELTRSIQRIATQIGEGFGATVEVVIEPQTPEVNNDPEITEQFSKAVQSIISSDDIVEPDKIMAAEDFALFQKQIPGCYFLVGTRDLEKKVVENWHHPKFRVNPEVLPLASKLLIVGAISQLKNNCLNEIKSHPI